MAGPNILWSVNFDSNNFLIETLIILIAITDTFKWRKIRKSSARDEFQLPG